MRYRLLSLLVCLVLSALVAAAATASTGRLRALGGEGTYLEDPANVLLWYGSLGDYPNLAIAETGTWKLNGGYPGEGPARRSGGWLGGHLAVPGGVTVAAFYTDRFDDGDPGQLIPSNLGHGAAFLACRVFGRAQIAAMLRIGSYSEDESDSTSGWIVPTYVPERIVRDNRRLDLGLGLRLDLGERAYLDAAVERRGVRLDEARYSSLEEDFEQIRESDATIAGRMRLFYQTTPNSALVPQVELQRVDQPLPIAWYGLVSEVDVWQLRIGTGWNYYPDPDRLIVLFYEYLYGEGDLVSRTLSSSFAESQWDLKWNAGRAGIALESRFLPWLTLRTAYRWERRSRSETLYSPIGSWSGIEPTEIDGIEHFLSLGAGLHLGRFDVDVAVAEGYPSAPGGALGTAYFETPRNWLTLSVRRTF